MRLITKWRAEIYPTASINLDLLTDLFTPDSFHFTDSTEPDKRINVLLPRKQGVAIKTLPPVADSPFSSLSTPTPKKKN